MRNVRWLWATIVLLLIVIFVLAAIIAVRLRNPPSDGTNASPPEPNTPPQAETTDRVLAVIGGKPIMDSELQTNLRHKYGKSLLDEMLGHMAVQMEADSVGITVTEPEISRELKKMQVGYESEDEYYKAMSELGLDRESLHQDTYYKLLTEKIATRNIRVSDSLVDEYIKNHPEEFAGYTQLRIRQIITDSKAQADKIEEELGKGKSFEELAKNRSLDDATRSLGGDLGWVDEDDPFVDARILDSAKKLQQGQVSDPIKLDSNYAVVQLDGRKEVNNGQTRTREDVRMDLALRDSPSLNDVVDQLKKKYKASILDPSLK
ncbi:MAG: putative PpiC-type peptidyl-prolyl cis-trans isomerase [Paenibacillaceae bacterium]|nr:putative PpiC-type peptidyl-prolyl cis-trans isomerase [Paenibacillaceae bacterium]